MTSKEPKEQADAKKLQGWIEAPQFRTCVNCRKFRSWMQKGAVRDMCSLGNFATRYNSTCGKHARKD